MKVILLGATGMVGQGVLRECLLDPAWLYPATPRGSDKDEVVRRIVRDDGAPLSSMEVAFLEVRDNDRVRRARDAERGQAGCL